MSTLSQAHYLIQEDLSDIVVHNDAAWNACAYSRRCPFKDTANEDAVGIFRVDEETAVFAVADGCGGMRGGEQASNMALQILGDSIERHDSSPDRMRVAILDGIEQANQAVQDLRIGAACTIAVVEFHRGVIRPYHVGDSMILVTGNRGCVRYQSVSHSPVGFAVESGMLCADEAMHHENRHIVSNVVGDPRMRIEIGPTITLSRRDTVLIASDGLFDNLNVHEVVEHIRKGKLATSVASMTDVAYERMLGIVGEPCKPDDLSVIAIRPILSNLNC
ncbi:MAG: protein phosphatase 2C domain-containing protein [Pirellula sp.]